MSESRRNQGTRCTVHAMVMVVLVCGLLCAAAGAAETVLRVLTYPRAWYAPYVEENIPIFEAAYPGVKVSLEKPANLRDRVVTEFAGGVSSDVILVGSIIDNIWRDVLAQDITRDLRPFVERDGQFGLKDFFPALVEAFTHGDKLVGIPTESTTAATFINKTLFDEAGLAYPGKAWDWQDALKMAKLLTKDFDDDGVPDQWGFSADGYALHYLGASPFLWANGADIVDATQTKATLLEPAAQEALEFFTDLHFTHRVSVPPGLEEQCYLFWRGEIAIWESASWNISYNRQKAEPHVDWDIAYPIVSPRTGQPAPLVSGHVATISSTSTNPDLAWELIKFLFVSDAGQKGVAAQGMLPSRTAFGRYFVQTFEAPPQTLEPVLYAASIGRSPVWFKDPQVHRDVWGIIDTEWNAVMSERQSVRAFAEKVTPLVNNRLQGQ